MENALSLGLKFDRRQIILTLQSVDWNEEEAINNLLNVQLVEGAEEQKQEQPQLQQARQQQDPTIVGYRRTCLKGHYLVHHPANKAKRRTNRAG